MENLLDALGDGPAMLRFQRKGFQDQKIKRALHQIIGFSHMMIIYNQIVDRQDIGSVETDPVHAGSCFFTKIPY